MEFSKSRDEMGLKFDIEMALVSTGGLMRNEKRLKEQENIYYRQRIPFSPFITVCAMCIS